MFTGGDFKMYTPNRFYLNQHSATKIKKFIKNKNLYQITFIKEVWYHSDRKTFSNWLTAKTAIPSRDLLKLCAYMNISLEDLTAESFNSTYLSHKDSVRIKNVFKQGLTTYPKVAKSLNMDVATLQNWVYRYSCLSTPQYQQLLNELQLTALPLENIQQHPVEKTPVSSLEQQYQIIQTLRSLLLQHPNLLLGDLHHIPQHIVNSFLQQANIPEKNVIFFHHNAQEKQDFYAIIKIHGKPNNCILTFIYNLHIEDYGNISISNSIDDNYVIGKHLSNPNALQIIKPQDDVIKIATWFGSKNCLFAIRSASTFTIEVDTESQLSEPEVIAIPDMIVFFR